MAVSDDRRAAEVRVLVATSAASFARSLRKDLVHRGFVVCAAVVDASAAVAAAVSQAPDLCVLAADLPGSAVLATAEITDRVPRTYVVIVAEALDEDDCLTYLLAGATGYLEADLDRDRLAAALLTAAEGHAVVPPAAQHHLVQALRDDHL